MSVIVLDNNIVHYEVLGRGRPLILLHGWVGSWRYWIPTMQSASITFRAYAVDMWGFGDTAKNNAYTLEGQSRLLDGFMESMGIGRIALVGHGLGALLAVYYAMKHPDFVDRVMLISCPVDETMINPRLRTAPPAELAEWLLGRNPITEPVLTDAPKTDIRALQVPFEEIASESMRGAYKTLTTACLMVNGEKDPVVQSPRLDQLAELPETTHAVSFDQSGHFPMLDENSKFHRLLTDFLNLKSGDSPRELQLKEEWKRRVR